MSGATRVPGGDAGVLSAVVLAVVVLTMGLFVATTRDDGAATPEAAVSTLVDALERRDLIGVVEALPPGERQVLAEPLGRLGPELDRLGLTDGLDPRAIGGVDVQVDAPELRTTSLSDTVVAVDVVGGSVRASEQAGTVPLTPRLADLLAEQFGVEVVGPRQGSRDFAADPLRLMVVHEGGGWHVSLAYSIAEWARLATGAPLPAFGTGPDAIGGNTPDDTVRDLVKAYADSDPERAITLLSPVEARALYDYAPLFLDPVKRAGRRSDDEGTYDAQVNKLELGVEGSGGVRTVRIRALDVDVRDEVHKTHVVYDGRCFVEDQRFGDDDPPFATWTSCNGDATAGDAVTRPRDNPFSYLAGFGGGAELPSLVVIERNGRWFVSPVGSLLSSSVDLLRGLSPSQVEAAGARLGPSVRALTDRTDAAGPPADEDRPANDPDRLLAECQRVARQALAGRDVPPGAEDDLVADCNAHLVAEGRLAPP